MDVPPPPATRVVKLQRKAGRVVRDCDVYIGRRVARGGWDLPASKWANPYTVGKAGSALKAVALYRLYLQTRPDLLAAIKPELKGKRLGCWCAPGPCHGDVLAELADDTS